MQTKHARLLRKISSVGRLLASNRFPEHILWTIPAHRELAKKDTGKTLYILDEPTTGLHFEDIRILLGVLNQLVEKGNTIIVIEHNMDIIKCADFIIDIGPEGGAKGGEIVFSGTPEELIKSEKGFTSKFLKQEFS